MKTLMLSALCCAGLVAVSETVRAHGGEYRGPRDTVPPSPGGGGGRTGGPAGPTTGGPGGPSAPSPGSPGTGGPAGPTTGGPTTGGAPPAGGTTGGPRGAQLDDDLTRWDYWWEFNKDPYIRLRDSVHSGGAITSTDDDFFVGSTMRKDNRGSLRPSSEQILGDILPALKKAIDSTTQRDINSSCMIAMAKIGVDHPDFTLRSVFTPRLKRNDQEIRETAALSLGIAAIAGEEEMGLLSGLALDKAKGRDAYGGEVDVRTRAFATYGLGLVAHKTTTLAIKRQAFEVMRELLEDDKIGDRQIKVAAINGMSLLNIPSATDADKQLMADALKSLEGYYNKPLGSGEQLIQAHVPTAIAKLIGREHPESDRFKAMFADDLLGKGKVKRNSDFISMSCALALGKMARPHQDPDDKANPDNRYSKVLLQLWDKGDQQTQAFAMMGLGLIGGEQNKLAMMKEFDQARGQKRTWCGLALGVYSHWKHLDGAGGDPDPLIGQTLMKELKEAKDPVVVGAMGVALGLCKFTPAAEMMRKRALDNLQKEDAAGYLCIGLALMNDIGSIETIRSIVKQSTRRFQLLPQAAIALGKLGDKTVADDLQKLMTEGENNLAKLAAIARAIGFIGDTRMVAPLKRMLFDTTISELPRAFAAVALGGVADKEPLPWNSKIGVDNNYRASVETLTNQATGILDIL